MAVSEAFPGDSYPPYTKLPADNYILIIGVNGPKGSGQVTTGLPTWRWTVTYSIAATSCPNGATAASAPGSGTAKAPPAATTVSATIGGAPATSAASTNAAAWTVAPESLLSGFESFDARLESLETQGPIGSDSAEWQKIYGDLRRSWFSLGADAPGAYGALHALGEAHNYLIAVGGGAHTPDGQAARAELLREAAVQIRSAAKVLHKEADDVHGSRGQNSYDVYIQLESLAAEAESQATSADTGGVSRPTTQAHAYDLDKAITATFGKLQPVFGVDAGTVYGLYMDVQSHFVSSNLVLTIQRSYDLKAAIAAERALEVKFLRVSHAHK